MGEGERRGVVLSVHRGKPKVLRFVNELRDFISLLVSFISSETSVFLLYL